MICNLTEDDKGLILLLSYFFCIAVINLSLLYGAFSDLVLADKLPYKGLKLILRYFFSVNCRKVWGCLEVKYCTLSTAAL